MMNLLKEGKEHSTIQGKRTLGQKASDALTTFAGSWAFIIGMLIFMAIWMLINIYMIIYKWDPYPFILLNFVLSCLAAMQAPIILMSQNRQEERDRASADYDHMVNRRAEREIQDMQQDLEQIKEMLRKLNKSKN